MKLGIARLRCIHGLAVAAVFLGAFLLRLWASTTVPLTQDELMWIRIAEELSFHPQSLDLKHQLPPGRALLPFPNAAIAPPVPA